MELTYYGATCLQLSTKQMTAVIDPLETKKTGTKLPKIKADVVLRSQLKADSTLDTPLVIHTPGEYEIKGVSIQGIPARLHIDKPKDPAAGVMYRFEHHDISVLVAGNIAADLSDQQLEQIGEIKVLVVPVGGHGLTLDAQAAAGLVNRLEPNVIVPIHYDDGVTKYEMPQDKVDVFLQEVGVSNQETKAKLKITARTLPEDTEVVVLSNSAKK